jgi:SAM-dependent methyltransferase
MNARHSKVTDWGLSNVGIKQHFTILDIGCGGGQTVNKLAAVATDGKIYGVDYSSASVAVARKKNAHWIKIGRVEIQEGSVSQLSFAPATFDLIVAVETHFWWPDLSADFRELLRVLKPGGTLAIIAEVHMGAAISKARLVEKTGMKLLSPDEHKRLLTDSGFTDVQLTVDTGKGWILACGRKPLEASDAE